MLEWMPSDSGKKNRQLLWKKFTGADPNQWFGPIGLHPSGPTSWSSEERSDFKRGVAAGWQWGEDTLDYVIQEHPLYKAEQKGEEIAFDAIMYVTPKQYEDDVAALIFYGSFGLMDPTNIADGFFSAVARHPFEHRSFRQFVGPLEAHDIFEVGFFHDQGGNDVCSFWNGDRLFWERGALS